MTFLKSLAETFLFFAIKLRRRLQLREQWKKTTTLSSFSPPSFPWLSGTLRPERRFVASSSFAIFFPFFCQSRVSLCFFLAQSLRAPIRRRPRMQVDYPCTTLLCHSAKWGNEMGGSHFPRKRTKRGEKRKNTEKDFLLSGAGKAEMPICQRCSNARRKREEGKMCKRLVLRFFRFFPPSPSAARTQEKATIKSGAEHPVSSHIFDFSPMCSSYKYT